MAQSMNADAPPISTGYEESFVDFRGHRIACLARHNPLATRPPIVWLHGLTASFRFWNAAMYPEVERHHSWFSVSMPLHFPSTYTGGKDDVVLNEQLFADILEAVTNELIPEGKFHLVGYSLGGFAALNFTAKYPKRVLSVVSIGGFMKGKAKGLEGVLQYFAKGIILRKIIFYSAWWIMQRHVIFLKMATIFYARKWKNLLGFPYLDTTLRDIFPDVSRHRISYQRQLFRYLLEMNVMDEVEAIRQPVLVIAGDKDPVIPFDHQVEYAKLLPNAKLEVLAGVGHVAFAEEPVVFRELILEWVK